MRTKNKLCCLAFIALTTIGFSGCSKDDDVSNSDVEGTYAGEMTVYPATGIKTFDNTTLTITSAGEGKVKVTPAANTGGVAEIFDVFPEDGYIVNPENDPKGTFLFYGKDNSLTVSTLGDGNLKKPGQFRFKGVKQ